MGGLVELLQTLDKLSPIGVIALLGLIIFLLVRAKDAKIEMDKKVSLISENHLSGLPEMADSLRRIENQLQSMNDNIVYIRARVNGKS